MYIRKIRISDVRGFREVDLDLSRPDGSFAGWTVLAGRNGSGKSTLLKAMALAVSGPEAARALHPSFADWLRAGSTGAEVEVRLEPSADVPEEEIPSSWVSLQWKRKGDQGEPLLSGELPPANRSTPEGAREFDVYLSYRRNDRAEVLNIAQQLKARGIHPWIDVWGLKPGSDWEADTERALESTPVLAAFFGSEPDAGGFRQRELDSFLLWNRPVIPVLLSSFSSGGMPSSLRRLFWVDFRQADPDPLDELIWGITGRHPKRDGLESKPYQESVQANRQKWFLAAYGPYRRLSGHAVDAQRLMEGPEPISRVVSLFREDASLVESVGWLREIYLQRLEKKPGAAELEKAVLNLLDDGLLPDGVRVDQVDSDGLWVFQRDVRLPLRELSDGYRTIAALVMDIGRHLQRSFGELRMEQADDEEGPFWRVLHPGVVLIDEIDLHLHISWQKRVGFWLKRHFPNIQFLVTTHSPFICQAADPRGLIRLPAPGEDRPVSHVSDDLYNTIVNGSIDDVILTELFGVESPYSAETERLRRVVAELEAKVQTGQATDKDRQELRELRSRLPRTMSSSVEQALRALTVEG